MSRWLGSSQTRQNSKLLFLQQVVTIQYLQSNFNFDSFSNGNFTQNSPLHDVNGKRIGYKQCVVEKVWTQVHNNKNVTCNKTKCSGVNIRAQLQIHMYKVSILTEKKKKHKKTSMSMIFVSGLLIILAESLRCLGIVQATCFYHYLFFIAASIDNSFNSEADGVALLK